MLSTYPSQSDFSYLSISKVMVSNPCVKRYSITNICDRCITIIWPGLTTISVIETERSAQTHFNVEILPTFFIEAERRYGVRSTQNHFQMPGETIPSNCGTRLTRFGNSFRTTPQMEAFSPPALQISFTDPKAGKKREENYQTQSRLIKKNGMFLQLLMTED